MPNQHTSPPSRAAFPIIDSAQLVCIAKSRVTASIFLTAIASPDGGTLNFRAERVNWDHRTGTNVPIGLELFSAAEFSAWWAKKRRHGWRFSP